MANDEADIRYEHRRERLVTFGCTSEIIGRYDTPDTAVDIGLIKWVMK